MRPLQYALVAYVTSRVGKFVESLRSELYPEHAHLAAHITILPPRTLRGTEEQALSTLERLLEDIAPFEVGLGDVESFIPATPTVFIRVARGAYKLRELHDRLNVEGLRTDEQWPYMPHLTIVKMATLSQAQQALLVSRERWDDFGLPERVLVDELTFVREGEHNRWVDLATLRLGQPLAKRR